MPTEMSGEILGTRAVLRVCEAGSLAICTRCDLAVKFNAIKKPRKVIANIYHGKKWDRLETFHEQCYLDAGEPYGVADPSKMHKQHAERVA